MARLEVVMQFCAALFLRFRSTTWSPVSRQAGCLLSTFKAACRAEPLLMQVLRLIAALLVWNETAEGVNYNEH